LFGRLRLYLWPLLCLFQGSLVIGYLAVHHEPAEPEEPPVPVVKHDAERPIAPPHADEEKLDPRQGEAHLRDGKFALALPHLLPTDAELRAGLPDVTLFSAGLCLEGLGRWKEALGVYREAVARTANPRLQAAAQVCQARVWARRGQGAEAKALLRPLLLEAGQPGRFDSAVVAEAHFLLGLAISRVAFGEQHVGTADDLLAIAPQAAWPVAQSASWSLTAESKGRAGELPPLEVLQGFGDRPEEVLIAGSAPEEQLPALVERLAGLVKLTVVWSAPAWQPAGERAARLALDGLPLLDVIQSLLEPHGLFAHIKDGAVHVVTEAEAPADMLAEARRSAARRALRAAVFAAPEHPLAVVAHLELGNDEAAAGRLDEALAWYDRLVAEAARSPHLSAAFYNLGLIQKARADYPAARKAFYRVVDRSPGHELAPRALLQVGWTYLLEGQSAQALVPLRRALAQAPAGPAHPEALLAVAATLLLNGNPGEVNLLLNEHRELLAQDPWKVTASFVDALARYRVAVAAKHSRLEAADLLSAVLALPRQNKLGQFGFLLAGQACKEMGMPREMAKLYREALPRAVGAAAEEMHFELAEYLLAEGQGEPAVKMLNELAVMPNGRWSRAARLRLARVAVDEGKGQQAVEQGRALLKDAPAAEQTALLLLLGSAYEQVGDFQRAARCYAGQVPD
jgi:tetratricopeptide (TPR) repeat protein